MSALTERPHEWFADAVPGQMDRDRRVFLPEN
jgi:hypothetical protein